MSPNNSTHPAGIALRAGSLRVLVLAALVSFAAPALEARTYSFPHVFDQKGRISNTQFTFDTTLFMTYSAGLASDGGPAPGAVVHLYLYDSASGLPLQSAARSDVCNPCSFALGAEARARAVAIEELVEAAGGFAGNAVSAFALLDVEGDDEEVSLEVSIVEAKTGPFDLAIRTARPEPVPPDSSGEPSTRRTLVLPHILEVSGSTTTQAFTFDTTVFATYTAGLIDSSEPTGAQVDVYLFDDATGLPMTGKDGAGVCNPCTFDLSSSSRKQVIRLDDLIEAAGGFDVPVRLAFLRADVRGDADHVSLLELSALSRQAPLDLELFGFEPQLEAPPGSPSPRRTVVFPHVLEVSGRITNTQNTFDTQFFMTYSGGLDDGTAGAGATVDLYVIDQSTGAPLRSATDQEVCNPCTYPLGGPAGGGTAGAPRKRTVVLDSEITDRGGFAGGVVLGYAIAVLDGADPGSVAITSAVTNAKSSSFDLAVFGFEPQPIAAAANLAPALKRSYSLPHVLEVSGRITNTQFTFDTTVFMTYTPGLPGGPGGPGAGVDLFLYDAQTGLPLRSASAEVVCNPCSFSLDDATRKRSVSIEELIEGAGGFATPVVQAFGVVEVSGDSGNVAFQGFTASSKTSPFDLSGYGFELCPLPSREVSAEPTFVRGDANGDGDEDISDPIFILDYLFLGNARPRCLRALNVDGRGVIDLSDAVYLLNFLFQGTAPPAAPYPDCGPGSAEEGELCLDPPPCPR